MGASPSSPSKSSSLSKSGIRRPKSVKHNLQDHVYSMLRQCMYQLPFPPNSVTEEAVQRMAMAVERMEIIESQFVLLKGAKSKGIYIIAEGEAHVLSSQGDIIANLLPGDFFGELSTLFNIPCTASVQALERTRLLLLKEEKLRQAMGEESVVSIELEDYFVRQKYFDTNGTVHQATNLENIARLDLRKIPLFSKWGEAAMKNLLTVVSPNSEVGPVTLVPPNTFICHEMEDLDEFTVITKGIVAVMHEKRLVTELDAKYWPLWFGEQEHFTGRRAVVSIRTVTACQAVVIKFSDIIAVKNHYKEDVSTSLRFWNEKWRRKISQLDKIKLTGRNTARAQIQVLIKKLHESGIASNAPVAMYHQLAIAALPKQCQDGTTVYAPKTTVGEITGRSKSKRKEKATKDAIWSMTLEDAEQIIEDDDKLFLVLQGSIGITGSNTTTFRAGLPVWVPISKAVTLEAKENSLVFQISGATLLQATQMYPAVRLNLPPTVA